MFKKSMIFFVTVTLMIGMSATNGFGAANPNKTVVSNIFDIATDDKFTPDGPPIPHEEPVLDWEEPPVPTVYNPKADINTDGHVDKSEWEKWVAENPSDLDQDLHITAEEQAEFNRRIATASPTNSKVLINGKSIQFEAYNIDDSNYFKLRDIAQALSGSKKQFEVTWDDTNNAINLITERAYTNVGGELVKGSGSVVETIQSSAKVYKNGQLIDLTAYTINGNNYFKLRDIGAALDFEINWDGTTNTILINTGDGESTDTSSTLSKYASNSPWGSEEHKRYIYEEEWLNEANKMSTQFFDNFDEYYYYRYVAPFEELGEPGTPNGDLNKDGIVDGNEMKQWLKDTATNANGGLKTEEDILNWAKDKGSIGNIDEYIKGMDPLN